jgi:mono/diheme cytochrome c family protein
MPHPLPLLAAVAAVSLLGMALRSAPAQAQADDRPAAAMLPSNLCASCHGGGRAAVAGQKELEAGDVMAARAYLRGSPQG